MSFVHHMSIRARPGCSPRLGQCLARLQRAAADHPGCLRVSILRQAEDPLAWRVDGLWRSAAAHDAFVTGDGLRQLLAEALGEDLIARLDCATPRLQQVA